MTDTAALLSQDHDQVRVLTINRPTVLNAWSPELELALADEFVKADRDQDVRAVVITGSGDRAFCAGADLSNPKTHVVESVESYLRELRPQDDPKWLRPVLELRKPLIGAINGYAIGAGCSLAMACDILIGASNAEFRFPQTSLGILPIHGGSTRLAQWIGRGRAAELIFTGRPLRADEALQFGLLSRVVDVGEVLVQALELAMQLAEKPPLAMALAKESLRQGLETESLRATSSADLYRYFALMQTRDSLDVHDEWRERRDSNGA